MYSQRAIRDFTTDAVPEEIIGRVLDAAIRAPSATNAKFCHFVVVRDPDVRAGLGALYLEVQQESYGNPEVVRTWLADKDPRVVQAAADFAEVIHEVPVLIVVCSTEPHVESSVYPAVQNLMLAARSLGLGTVLTTMLAFRAPQARELLGMPDEAIIHCMIPLGWPAKPFGPVRRWPVEEVTHWDGWGAMHEHVPLAEL